MHGAAQSEGAGGAQREAADQSAAGGLVVAECYIATMFTGIVQGKAAVADAVDLPGLRRFRLRFDEGFCDGLAIGASVSVEGTCLTVTARHGEREADFDVMQQSLRLTTLAALQVGSAVNVERAARDGAEIGGHPLSGHVDFMARIARVLEPDNNRVLRLAVPAPWMRYVFAKGYIAVNGASLTVAEATRERDGSGWFEVWLIPETLRVTTLKDKVEGDHVNIEIDRSTQVFVDTVRSALDERLGPLLPMLEGLMRQQGLLMDDLAAPPPLARD